MERRIAFYTFGCKLNQCETAGVRSRFAGAGYAVVPFEGPAEVYIVNTCSVTGRADAQARQLVRRLVRERSGHVVVTGCYAQRAPRELAAIPGVSLVTGNGEKDRLTDLVDRLMAGPPGRRAAAWTEVSDLRREQRSFDLAPVEFGERTRAYLRVQDGCDAGCSFCIIPKIRGRGVSLGPAAAIDRFGSLVAAGYREVVLTGIHLGLYGHDLGGVTLADLVDRIESLPGDFRLRLSSIEPQEIDGRLVDRLAAGGRLVPHLHVPLQSGSDSVLAAMNRTYGAADYRRVIERLATRVDPIGIGADVIVGFPGESHDDFEATCRLIESLPVTYLHVFPWSARPGTRAATLPGRVSGPVQDERGARLRALSNRKQADFAARFVGRDVHVLVEEPTGDDAWEGWSEHYLRVAFPWPGSEDLSGRIVRVRVDSARGDRLVAWPVEISIDAPASAR